MCCLVDFDPVVSDPQGVILQLVRSVKKKKKF